MNVHSANPIARNGLRIFLACVAVFVLVVLPACLLDEGVPTAKAAKVDAERKIDGEELFTREWIPGDRRSHGGDGLGPMFNESSCVACHNLGGVGGAGPASKNVDIVTAFNNRRHQQAASSHRPMTLPKAMFRSIFGDLDGPQAQQTIAADPEEQAARGRQQQKEDREALAKVHPGFLASPSIVLHRNATYAGYQPWRARMAGMHFRHSGEIEDVQFFRQDDAGGTPPPTNRVHRASARNQLRTEVQVGAHRGRSSSRQVGNFAIVRSQRNTTALFGAGDMDRIPTEALEKLAEQQTGNSEVSGRVARLKDGRVGRFGWKAQTATLRDFVLTACAVELGLNVPGHPQAGVPQKPDYQPKKLDLNEAECNALISYVANLPAPVQRKSSVAEDAAYVDAGKELFTSVGCAACHVADVGEATGIYSDLLLHDMGPELGDTGSYGVFVPNSTPDGKEVPLPDLASRHRPDQPNQKKIVGATRQEWRTPPLWGVRDSAPYLHDGRAATLEQAIAVHGGEASGTVNRYFQLSAEDRFKVVTFLKSLSAP